MPFYFSEALVEFDFICGKLSDSNNIQVIDIMVKSKVRILRCNIAPFRDIPDHRLSSFATPKTTEVFQQKED